MVMAERTAACWRRKKWTRRGRAWMRATDNQGKAAIKFRGRDKLMIKKQGLIDTTRGLHETYQRASGDVKYIL
jgi:hypothetical protein